MKRWNFAHSRRWAALLCLWAAGMFAASATAAAEPARLPFFEASKGNLRVYVLGTMHAGKPDEPLRQEIAQALSGSSKLVLEVTTEEMAKTMPMLLSYLCEDACLRRQLSEKTLAQLSRQQGALLGAAGLERMPAWLVSMLLASADYMKAGLLPQGGTEQRLSQIWGRRSIQGLETAEEQLRALASLDDKTQGAMLEDYLSLSEEKRAALLARLYSLWQSGDADALYDWHQRVNEEQGISPRIVRETNDKLVVARNRRFVERLIPLLSPDKPVFVAVGALHLGGKDGVLALLRAQGFSVTPR